MFLQMHMLRSMPPGNLNRDETGQPKQCLFGGATRGRISSQCFKRRIRLSPQFKGIFADNLANKTQYFPELVAEEIESGNLGLPSEDVNDIKKAFAKKFKSEKKETAEDNGSEGDEDAGQQEKEPVTEDKILTPQLVFFQKPFVRRAAELLASLRTDNERAYNFFLGRNLRPKVTKEEKEAIKGFVDKVFNASKELTVDIALFGRMTTSDLIFNVEAACQVAHSISTHETIIESDYFTAMDDLKKEYASSQSKEIGAGFVSSGENETFFNASVYYQYLNLDLDQLEKSLENLASEDAAMIAGVLVDAAIWANPTGKQNAFASYGVPELALAEVSAVKRPISYANAFLQPVEGGAERNLMCESAKALKYYIESVGNQFAPGDQRRILLAVGPAAIELEGAERVDKGDHLREAVTKLISSWKNGGAQS